MIQVDSSDWTGLPSSVRPAEGPYGEFMSEADDAAMYADECRRRLLDRIDALRMLWGPAIRNRPWKQKDWTVYDGYMRHRGEEWTFWRGVGATVAIILNRYHGDAHGRCLDSLDLGHWDASTAGNGYSSAMVCWLFPRCRFQIFSDGD